ncbi:hypothetical protein BDV24DRAFT_49299 [Aspergillus arachidicola]|uniref:Uncharacterized protein n=1 Tax=Aspergillus arachidicola TaxID=656916 RepID=A0A5N6Y849_9EURO|nr:hypothetical protein BDV24DRAFT_49299 [Aspergillus arachidicola]
MSPAESRFHFIHRSTSFPSVCPSFSKTLVSTSSPFFHFGIRYIINYFLFCFYLFYIFY